MKHASLTGAALLALAYAAPAAAQETAAGMILAAGHTLLTVQAEGMATREPDIAMFTAGVTTEGSTASAALAENSRRMTDIFTALKAAGIAPRDMQTNNLNISPVYAQPKRLPNGTFEETERRITGYRVVNSVSVRQRKLDDYGKVIDALVSAGANQVNGPRFSLDQPEAAQDEARADAIKSARQQAEVYAKAAGLHVVRIVSITEAGGYSPEITVSARKMSYASVPPPPPPPPLATGEAEVTARVSVRFELAP